MSSRKVFGLPRKRTYLILWTGLDPALCGISLLGVIDLRENVL